MSELPKKYFRRVIKITAWDSPNVIYGLEEEKQGLTPSNKIVVPGVLPFADFKLRLATWTEIQIHRGLKALFWDGAESKLFPETWLESSAIYAESLQAQMMAGTLVRNARAMGIDTAQGGDETVWTIVDEYGLLHQEEMRTIDTSIIGDRAKQLGRQYRIPAKKWIFDRGGGGKQIVDYLRREGYDAQTVPFGGSVDKEHKEGGIRKSRISRLDEREQKELTYEYFNRRSEMYGQVSKLLDPSGGENKYAPDILKQLSPSPPPGALALPVKKLKGFAIPKKYAELRRQLSLIPRSEDGEGRLKLPPKNKKTANSNEVTMKDLIGRSPDQADSFVLAVYGLIHEVKRIIVGGR